MTDTSKKLRIIHFNDVYNAWPKERGDIVGGGARFKATVDSYRKGGSNFNGVEPMVFFSGDVFFPSIASQVSLGKHMVPILNALKISCSCLGNHDNDHGVDIFSKRAKTTNFPWVLSNVKIKSTGHVFTSDAGTLESTIIKSPDGELNIGIIGLAEEQWIDTLSCIDPADIEYEDFIKCTQRLAPKLREQGADFVIALTHMRVPRDELLAKEGGDEISLILGGHDHDNYRKTFERHNISVVKSGTDFLEFSVIDMELQKNDDKETSSKKPLKISSYKCAQVDVTRDLPEDKDLVKELEPFIENLRENMKRVIGHSDVALDCRFRTIRTKESNISNFVGDCIRWNIVPKPDVVLINSGTLRTDDIIPPGPYTVSDLMTMLPMLDFLVVLKMTGRQLLEALENGVSQYPALEGRFPFVSGIRFKFDPREPPGKRVLENSVVVGSDALDPEKFYTLCTKEYLAEGRDGYDVFKDAELVVESELLPALSTCVSRFFLAQKVAMKLMNAGAKHHATNENVKLLACKWFEKALKRSPSCTPRSAMATPISSFTAATGTPRANESESDSPTRTNDGESDGEDAEAFYNDGKTPTISWATKVFRMNPRVERRIYNIAPSKKQEDDDGNKQ